MTHNEAKALYETEGNMKRAASKAHMRIATFRELVRGAKPEHVSRAAEATKPATAHGRTLSDFRAEYDKSVIVPQRVKAQIARMGATWLYEVEFAKAAGISLYDLGAFRDQFADHIVLVRERKVWAGTKALAQAMKEAI